MRTFEASCADDGLEQIVNVFLTEGEYVEQDSRNGPVRRIPGPVLINNFNPVRKFVFLPARNANPVFHMVESIWMLAGRRDLAPLLPFNAGMSQYSDDGSNLRGTAYGYRWREHFNLDGLETAISRLKKDPTDRRIVMSMWDPNIDLVQDSSESKDLPCNLQVMFSSNADNPDRLDMTVTNRSNDLIYGCYGSNIFHFSMLLEYVAASVGMKVGNYYQFTNNLHIYTDNKVVNDVLRHFAGLEDPTRYSVLEEPNPFSYVKEFGLHEASVDELNEFLDWASGKGVTDFGSTYDPKNAYLVEVVAPSVKAYMMYKSLGEAKRNLGADSQEYHDYKKDILTTCVTICQNDIKDPDYSEACVNWFARKI